MNKETLYPGSFQYPPMLYCGKPTKTAMKQAFESGKFFAGEKLDGALYQIEKTDDGKVYMFSRTKSKKTGELAEKGDNFPHIVNWALTFLPKGTILVGEVYIPGGHSNTVTKISGCLPAKAYARQFDKTNPNYLGPAHYYAFDILRFRGENLIDKPAIERAEKYLWGEEIGYSFTDQEYIHRQEIIYDNFEEKLQEIFSRGGEGLVFKAKDCPYRVGKRSTASQAFKWKQHLDSVDLICIGLEDPIKEYSGKELDTWPYWMEHSTTINGKHLWYPIYGLFYEEYKRQPHVYKPVTKPFFYGWKNSMSLGCYKDGEIVYVGKVASGITDEMRADMAEHPENYLNKVVQISCMSVDPKEGTIRHPVWEMMREDKNPEDCIWEDIFNS